MSNLLSNRVRSSGGGPKGKSDKKSTINGEICRPGASAVGKIYLAFNLSTENFKNAEGLFSHQEFI